jgi:putative flippase GtrA
MGYLRLDALYNQCTYCRYFVIGAVVGCLAILAREAIAALLPADTPVYYTLSVALVYVGGILASYYGHRKVTFRDTSVSGRVFKSFSAFVLIAIFGMLATASLSILFRYGIPVQVGRFQPSLAFALATLATSLLTYRLNKNYAFGTASEVYRQGHEARSRT